MNDAKELIIDPIITLIFTGVVSFIGTLVSIGVVWIIKNLKKQGNTITQLTNNLCVLVDINKKQTDNISTLVPVSRKTLKGIRSLCYSQEETFNKSPEQAKKSLQNAFKSINDAEDELNKRADCNTAMAMSGVIQGA
jgi:hypothetical protein